MAETTAFASERESVEFWKTRAAIYPLLSEIALDLTVAPASQAYVERVFSSCGLLCAGRRNRMKASLEKRVFLKMNSDL